MFVRSSNHNFSLDMQCAFTQDWLNSFWIAVTYALSCFLYRKVSSLNLLNLYKCKQVFFRYCSLCILFRFILTVLLLLVYLFIPFFYADVVAIFLFICWSCKQVHCFVSGAFVNNTISIFVIIWKPWCTAAM